MMQDSAIASHAQLCRRAFVAQGALFLAGVAASWSGPVRSIAAATAKSKPRCVSACSRLALRRQASAGSRSYRETIAKLAEATQRFQQDKTDLVFELGDLVDAAESVEAERGYVRRMAEGFAAAPGQHHYVLGNHCVYSLTKPEFLQTVGQKASYYSGTSPSSISWC